VGDRRVVCWFSCGITSAVATKIAIKKYKGKNPIHIIYTDTSSEHQDNVRFLKDCEAWFDHEITILHSEKYKDMWDVFNKGWLVGVHGAMCTTELKKKLRHDFQRVDDIQVFGYDASEANRIERFRNNNPEITLETPLFDKQMTKGDCHALLKMAGIKKPFMYSLGYKNNNCIGCVKGGGGYWNKIRIDFPDIFKKMAELERKLDVSINKTYAGDGKRKRLFLDEMPSDFGNYKEEPNIDCGLLCQIELQDLD